jgi:hypothetical protein
MKFGSGAVREPITSGIRLGKEVFDDVHGPQRGGCHRYDL